MNIKSVPLLLIIFLLIPSISKSQDDFSMPDSLTSTLQINDSISSNNSTLYKALGGMAVYYAGSMYILSQTWYKGRDVVGFHLYDDLRGYQQVDKFGHTFGAYVYSYIGYHFLLNTGFSKKEALLYGATLGLILQTPVEIMDGIHEGYGFSLSDMAANTLGSALVFGQALLFDEQIIKFKYSYWESDYSRKANGYLGSTTFDRIFKDYNGHSYWFSIPINKIKKSDLIPDWLCISIGYGAKGMYGEFENISEYKGKIIPQTIRYRQYLLSLDIDWAKIETDSKFLEIILNGLTFIKLPFPTLELNSKGEFKGYYLYY